jgi:hypothetical protein
MQYYFLKFDDDGYELLNRRWQSKSLFKSRGLKHFCEYALRRIKADDLRNQGGRK